jgi:hypothetical protein
LKAAVLVGTFQRTILQQPVTVENVTEDELKNWLKPERDENRNVPDAELEKIIAAADWLYGVRYVFAVDQMLQSIGAAFVDYDLEHLLELDAEMQSAAIVKLVIERIGPDDFRNTMEAIFQRNTEGERKNWSAFVRLLREQATLMDSCGVISGKSRKEPKM